MTTGRGWRHPPPLSCLADTKGLELAAPAGQGNFTAEHVTARGKMIRNLRALNVSGLVEGKK